MSFCKISSEQKHNNYTLIDNAFFNDYLLGAPADCVKVYMWGYFLASNESSDNSLDKMSRDLNITVEDISNVFLYWHELGLVQLVQLGEPQVIYKPVKTAIGNLKKFKVGKYNDFNILIQQLFPNRTISSNEFVEYYTVIESFHMDMDALLAICKYAISQKGDNVGHRYITTIAKNWACEQILTLSQVEQKIQELSTHDDKLVQVFKALGSKASPQIEDKEMLDCWLKELGFDIEVIVHVAKSIKSRLHKTDIRYLDTTLRKYYEMKLMTNAEIDEYETNKQTLLVLAKDITKSLGLYSQDLSQVVDVYVLPFIQMGCASDLLTTIANYCFKQSIRTLEGYADIVRKFYKLGILNMEAFNQYMTDILANDTQIKNILEKLGLVRRVNEQDRNFYRTWTKDWTINDELLDYACELSANKPGALVYMNKILSNWHSAGINDLASAKAFAPASVTKPTKSARVTDKVYTKEELDSFFSNLDEVEV